MILPHDPSPEQLEAFLRGDGPDDRLFLSARRKLLDHIGNGVYLRGIVEISNRCGKNCFYCGLRRDSTSISRYTMPTEEIMTSLERGYRIGLRSFLLQSGELQGGDHVEMVAGVLELCSSMMPDARMVLSLGELPEEDCDRLRSAGGHRYLLRMETSSFELYRRYHPDDAAHSHTKRLRTLEYLRDSGWQTGTGVLIGLPDQSPRDLADDLVFMKDMDVDMVGMGPYIKCPGTPLWERREEVPSAEDRVLLTLRMIALARILMPRVNIAATTALQTLDPGGLERGLTAGANVVMPSLTPHIYRKEYDLYTGKTSVSDTPEKMVKFLEERCRAAGRELKLRDPGDPPHYGDRMRKGEIRGER